MTIEEAFIILKAHDAKSVMNIQFLMKRSVLVQNFIISLIGEFSAQYMKKSSLIGGIILLSWHDRRL
jgi:hypothetical protein